SALSYILFILTILLILSKGFSKIRIHSSSFSIKPAAFQPGGGASEYLVYTHATFILLALK
ncbi:MAG: hypothetical protein WCB15_19900, partial [Desulfobacterales bacterium]